MIGNLIATLFLSRDVAHREHLKTTSYAAHMALGDFYDEVVDLADSLAEAYQGRFGIIENIPYLSDTMQGDITDKLAAYLKVVEHIRYEAVGKEESALQNIVDEVVALFLSTLYKLRRFK
jgi:hypothetical protein